MELITNWRFEMIRLKSTGLFKNGSHQKLGLLLPVLNKKPAQAQVDDFMQRFFNEEKTTN
jgi:hypothetical protein